MLKLPDIILDIPQLPCS